MYLGQLKKRFLSIGSIYDYARFGTCGAENVFCQCVHQKSQLYHNYKTYHINKRIIGQLHLSQLTWSV